MDDQTTEPKDYFHDLEDTLRRLYGLTASSTTGASPATAANAANNNEKFRAQFPLDGTVCTPSNVFRRQLRASVR
ncbi:MAG: hypothetical protein R3B90_05950 [Planctomycetaceae bacterium]